MRIQGGMRPGVSTESMIFSLHCHKFLIHYVPFFPLDMCCAVGCVCERVCGCFVRGFVLCVVENA